MYMQILKGADVLVHDSVIGKLLSMFETTWVYKSIFSTVNFMKSDYKYFWWKLASALRCAVSVKYTRFQRLSMTKRIENIAIISYIDYMMIFGICWNILFYLSVKFNKDSVEEVGVTFLSLNFSLFPFSPPLHFSRVPLEII